MIDLTKNSVEERYTVANGYQTDAKVTPAIRIPPFVGMYDVCVFVLLWVSNAFCIVQIEILHV